MAVLRLALLGPPDIECDGAPLVVDTRKAVALLAYLAVTGERQGRDALAALLWPDHDTEHARGALRRTLSVLNKALGGRWLAVDRVRAGLEGGGADTVELDLAGFRSDLAVTGRHGHPAAELCSACVEPLSAAVARHRGPFMDGFALRDSPAFDDWQFFQADGVQRELASALERLVAVRAARREWQLAVAAARDWVAIDQLHEPAHRRLMELDAWSGHRGGALRQYRDLVRVLDEELGVPPLDGTTELYQLIAEGRAPPLPEPLGPPTAGPAQAPAPAPDARVPGPVPAVLPLIGRAAELAALRDAHAGAGPDGRLVVVEGEAGIGKTRLAAELADHVRARGGAVITVRCYEEEAGLAYGPVAEALRAAAALPDRTWAGRVGAHWLAEAVRLAPELAELRPGLPEPDSAGSAAGPGAQRRLLDGVASTLAAALGGPVASGPSHTGTEHRPVVGAGLLVLDDLHWADAASLDLVTFLVRRLAGRPLCLLLTWRSEHAPDGSRLRRLAETATTLRPGRLSRAEVETLVLAAAPERAAASLSASLYVDTEGLPFFLAEYLAAPAGTEATVEPASQPEGVRALLRARVGAAGPVGGQVLTAAAVIGRSFDFETVRLASGRGDEETVAALEELVALGLVAEVPGGPTGQAVYDFSHEQLRVLVAEQTSLARRRLLHRRVADAIATRVRAHSEPEAAAAVARHLQLAGADAEAAEQFARAGDHAARVHANAEALGHYADALALGHPDPAALHEATGDLHTLAGDYDAALASYEAAAARTPADLARLEQKLGRLHDRRGDWGAAEHHFQAALAALEDLSEPDPGRRARVLADASRSAHRRGQPERALALATDGLALAEAARPVDVEALAETHNMLGVLAARAGDQAGALGHLERSLALAGGLTDQSARVAALNNLALARRAAGDLDKARQLTEAALAVCVAQGDRHREAALRNNLADVLHGLGRAEEAMAELKQAVAIFAEVGEQGRLEPEIWKLVEW